MGAARWRHNLGRPSGRKGDAREQTRILELAEGPLHREETGGEDDVGEDIARAGADPREDGARAILQKVVPPMPHRAHGSRRPPCAKVVSAAAGLNQWRSAGEAPMLSKTLCHSAEARTGPRRRATASPWRAQGPQEGRHAEANAPAPHGQQQPGARRHEGCPAQALRPAPTHRASRVHPILPKALAKPPPLRRPDQHTIGRGKEDDRGGARLRRHGEQKRLTSVAAQRARHRPDRHPTTRSTS